MRRLCRPAGMALVGLALLMATQACRSGPSVIEVTIDGGTEQAVIVGTTTVRAHPGDTLMVINGNRGSTDPAAGSGTVTHALVGTADGRLPPVFVYGDDGSAPNAAVWGSCRGGSVDDADQGCPERPPEGVPIGWDGQAYWSTGAMLPGESHNVLLSEEISLGTHRLICALHPDLVIGIEVTDGDTDSVVGPPEDFQVEPAGASGGNNVSVGPVVGRTQHNAFVPAELEVEVGDEVAWTSEVFTPHDLTFGVDRAPDLPHTEPSDGLPTVLDSGWDGDRVIRSGYLTVDPENPAGSTYSVRFTQAGTYRYYCRFHPSMSGTVIVS